MTCMTISPAPPQLAPLGNSESRRAMISYESQGHRVHGHDATGVDSLVPLDNLVPTDIAVPAD